MLSLFVFDPKSSLVVNAITQSRAQYCCCLSSLKLLRVISVYPLPEEHTVDEASHYWRPYSVVAPDCYFTNVCLQSHSCFTDVRLRSRACFTSDCCKLLEHERVPSMFEQIFSKVTISGCYFALATPLHAQHYT